MTSPRLTTHAIGRASLLLVEAELLLLGHKPQHTDDRSQRLIVGPYTVSVHGKSKPGHDWNLTTANLEGVDVSVLVDLARRDFYVVPTEPLRTRQAKVAATTHKRPNSPGSLDCRVRSNEVSAADRDAWGWLDPRAQRHQIGQGDITVLKPRTVSP